MAEVSFLRAVIAVSRTPAGIWITGLAEGSISGLQRNNKIQSYKQEETEHKNLENESLTASFEPNA